MLNYVVLLGQGRAHVLYWPCRGIGRCQLLHVLPEAGLVDIPEMQRRPEHSPGVVMSVKPKALGS